MTAHDTGRGPRNITPEERKNLCSNVALDDLIGRSIQLTRNGHEFEALCPFHQEDTPSFTVVPGKGFFHCFGCGAHGDALGWLTDGLRMSFTEAVAYLRDASGKALPEPPAAFRQEAKIPSWIPVHPVPAGVPPLMQADGRTARI